MKFGLSSEPVGMNRFWSIPKKYLNKKTLKGPYLLIKKSLYFYLQSCRSEKYLKKNSKKNNSFFQWVPTTLKTDHVMQPRLTVLYNNFEGLFLDGFLLTKILLNTEKICFYRIFYTKKI